MQADAARVPAPAAVWTRPFPNWTRAHGRGAVTIVFAVLAAWVAWSLAFSLWAARAEPGTVSPDPTAVDQRLQQVWIDAVAPDLAHVGTEPMTYLEEVGFVFTDPDLWGAANPVTTTVAAILHRLPPMDTAVGLLSDAPLGDLAAADAAGITPRYGAWSPAHTDWTSVAHLVDVGLPIGEAATAAAHGWTPEAATRVWAADTAGAERASWSFGQSLWRLPEVRAVWREHPAPEGTAPDARTLAELEAFSDAGGTGYLGAYVEARRWWGHNHLVAEVERRGGFGFAAWVWLGAPSDTTLPDGVLG